MSMSKKRKLKKSVSTQFSSDLTSQMHLSICNTDILLLICGQFLHYASNTLGKVSYIT